MSTGLDWAGSLPVALESVVTNGQAGWWARPLGTEAGDAAGLEPRPLLENLQSCRSAYPFKRG